MPNTFAYLTLLVWPLVALVLFRRLPADKATVWTILGAYLLLPPFPTQFDLPLLPPLDKELISAMAAFAGVAWTYGPRGGYLPQSGVGRALLVLFILAPVGTVLTNGDPVIWGRFHLRGLWLRDLVALVILQALLLLPFLAARRALAVPGGLRTLAMAILAGALAYSLPMLLEVRLSPQLNIWVYGYFQHFFEQMVRGDGFRPIVFLYHGLWAAFLAMMGLAMAVIAFRHETRARGFYFGAALYMAAVLVACKSAGSLVYAFALTPMLLLLPARWQLNAALALALLALSYPVMRSLDLVPVGPVLALVTDVFGPERAASLQYRMENEVLLLERAMERPFFGWGSWGRNMIINPISGAYVTVTDGRWIITLGRYGWVGLAAEMVFLCLPIFMLWRQVRRQPRLISPFAAPLALVLAVNVADLLPNATLTPLTWLLAGALLAHAEALKRLPQGAAPARATGAEARKPAPLWQPILR